MPAAWLAHDLHHEAWKRSTSTFLPMRERESKGSPPVMSGTCTAGAAGAATPGAGTMRTAARATAGTMRFTAHSIIAGMTDLERELGRVVEGDVRFDQYSRLLYSTDASMYQVEPIGVVIPRHAGDVQAVVEIANRLNAPLLPRGGGTSLTGQTVNHAVVLDFSRYMNRVLEVNEEELWARVQPGLVQDELNHHVRGQGLLFGPDTSTSNRATIGGMLGNNSGGSHSIAYGLTVEHVLEIEAILSDGSRATFGEIAPDAFRAKMQAPGLEGQIYREVARIRDQYGDELTDKMILDLARQNIEQSKRMGFVQGDPAAILIVEYAGESDGEVKSKVEAL